MAYKVKQFRYYGEGHQDNWPKNISINNLSTGSIFKDYAPITQLGIQYEKSKPIKFYINDSINPILSHPYGLYELDMTGKTQILALKFDMLDDNGKALVDEKNPLIVDIVYIEG